MTDVNIPTVFTTTGFIIPLTTYHAPYAEVHGVSETLFSKVYVSNTDKMTQEYFKANNIFVSDLGRSLYDKYIGEPTLDNFIPIVDMVTEILSQITPQTFFQWQAGNPHISTMSLSICSALITGKFVENHLSYNVINPTSRFVIQTTSTPTRAAQVLQRFNEELTKTGNKASWTSLLLPLMNSRAAFVTFFKYVFVDFY